MKKATTLLELLVTICIVIVVVQFSYVTINKLKTNAKNLDRLRKFHNEMQAILENNKTSGSPSINWNWNIGSEYQISKDIMDKYILPYFYKKSTCNPVICVGGFLSLDKEEYLNYKQTTDYASAIVGDDNIHIALKTTRNCQKNNPNSLCGLFIVDVDNKAGYNQLGYDVFMFGFYGNGALMPYDYYFPKEKINAGCTLSSYGDTCAAKIVAEDWNITYLDKPKED